MWDDQGQDLIEYVLIGSVVSIGALLGAQALGTRINGWYNRGRDLGSGAARDQRPASLIDRTGGEHDATSRCVHPLFPSFTIDE